MKYKLFEYECEYTTSSDDWTLIDFKEIADVILPALDTDVMLDYLMHEGYDGLIPNGPDSIAPYDVNFFSLEGRPIVCFLCTEGDV